MLHISYEYIKDSCLRYKYYGLRSFYCSSGGLDSTVEQNLYFLPTFSATNKSSATVSSNSHGMYVYHYYKNVFLANPTNFPQPVLCILPRTAPAERNKERKYYIDSEC